MPDIDPITQEALRRASQMRGYNRGKKHPQSTNRKPKPAPSEKAPPEPPKPPKPSKPPDDPIKAFFKDKEESIILLLLLLLMGENADPSLLLALMFLLI